jgi:hypothetical protein
MNRDELHDLIAKHVATSAGDQAGSLDDIFKILEPLLEDTALQGRFSLAAVLHLEEKNKEIRSYRTARNAFLWIAGILIAFVLSVFYWAFATYYGHEALRALDNAKIAFVSATFLSGFGLLAIVLRGLFGVADKDDSGSPLVESVKALFEISKAVIK